MNEIFLSFHIAMLYSASCTRLSTQNHPQIDPEFKNLLLKKQKNKTCFLRGLNFRHQDVRLIVSD